MQEAISYITLEMLGGGVNVADNSPALQAFFDMAHVGICTELRLGPGKYNCASSVSVKAPHVIRGVGANFANSVQNGESSLVDDRPEGENDFFITVESESHSASDSMLYGWYWDCFSVIGTKSRNNRGVYFDAQGWSFQKNNVFIRDFGKTGLAFNYCADGTILGLFIGNCGGVVDGVAYYGLDLYPEDYAPMRGVANLIGFYRLHIEHCRYMMRLAGFDLAFTDSHFEIGFPVYDNNEHSPCINVRRLLRPVTLTNCYFTDPGWKSLVPDSVESPAEMINNIPAMFGTTYTSTQVLGGGEYDSKIELRSCKFTTHNGYGLYVRLPFVPVDMSDCHAMNCGMINSRVPFIVGPRSKFIGNRFFCKTITDDESEYADYVNNKTSPCVQVVTGWGTFNGNDLMLFGSAPQSLAAIVAPNALGSIVVGNKITGYTQEFGGAREGSQIYGGLSVTNNITVTDILPGALVSSGPSMSFRLPNAYTNASPVYSADGTSFSFAPNVDTGNAYLGLLTARWSEIRAKTATIATSDGRLKSYVRELSDTERQVANELKTLLRAFIFNADAYMPPNDSGKIHFGVIAQDAVAVFAKYGLDANDYAMIVHDKWDERPAVNDEDGNEISPMIVAGDRYGVRYEEMLAFIIAAL